MSENSIMCFNYIYLNMALRAFRYLLYNLCSDSGTGVNGANLSASILLKFSHSLISFNFGSPLSQ